MTESQLLARVVLNPAVLGGKPVIASTRISVDFILKLLRQGVSEGEILREHPRLKGADIRAALLYAEKVLEGETYFPAAGRFRR